MQKKIECSCLIDISQTLNKDMPVYPGIKTIDVHYNRSYENEDGMAESSISLNSHFGTHIESPFHFLKNGKKIEDLNLDIFCGPAQVIEIPQEFKSVTSGFVSKKNIYCERVLFKTGNSSLLRNKNFQSDYTYISEGLAEYLVTKNVKLVGLDYFCVDKYKDSKRSAHKALFRSGIVILETINLLDVAEGEYLLICLPLKISSVEASPCRAVLIKQ